MAKDKTIKQRPVSVRLTPEERVQLESLAVGMPLGAFIRERLFGEAATPRRTRGRHPVKDDRLLGQVLDALGLSTGSEA